MSRHREQHESVLLPGERTCDVRLAFDAHDFVIVTVDGERATTHGKGRMATALRCLAMAWREEQLSPPASREDSMAMAEAFLAKLRGG